MVNPYKGEVALGDYTLCMSFNAICELEDDLDRSINDIATEMATPAKMRLSTLRAVVLAALRENHPDVTKEDAGRLIGEVGVEDVGAKIGEAFDAAFPQAKEGSQKKGRPPKARP